MFPFHPYTVILDWYHLKKKCQELLSMAVKRECFPWFVTIIIGLMLHSDKLGVSLLSSVTLH